MTPRNATGTPATSLEVRERLVEALRLDLVGPGAGHPLAGERLPGWIRPSTWYLTGFLVPSGAPPEKRADADEDDDFELVPESAGLAEESSEELRAAKKGYFPSSIGLSFLVPKEARTLQVTVRWGDYAPAEIEGADGKPLPVWQRAAREARLDVPLAGNGEPAVLSVPGSGGLELHVVERPIAAEDLADHIPAGTRSVSIFLVNRRRPDVDNPDRAYAFQAETCNQPSSLLMHTASNAWFPQAASRVEPGKMTDEVLTIKEIAKFLKLAEKTAYSMAQRGELPTFNVRCQWRLRRADVDCWLEQQPEDQTSGEPGSRPGAKGRRPHAGRPVGPCWFGWTGPRQRGGRDERQEQAAA